MQYSPGNVQILSPFVRSEDHRLKVRAEGNVWPVPSRVEVSPGWGDVMWCFPRARTNPWTSFIFTLHVHFYGKPRIKIPVPLSMWENKSHTNSKQIFHLFPSFFSDANFPPMVFRNLCFFYIIPPWPTKNSANELRKKSRKGSESVPRISLDAASGVGKRWRPQLKFCTWRKVFCWLVLQ